MQKVKPFLVNVHPKYNFAELPKMPETQLVMVVPLAEWRRLAEYIAAYEAVHLAGRFGATPGDYEWEWISSPEGLRWWRRAPNGFESLWGMAVAVRRGAWVELYGLVEIDETSPFWIEVVPEEVAFALPTQAKLVARKQPQRSETDILAELYREYLKERGMLTQMQPGQPACRRGTIREVERFRDAIIDLLKRVSESTLPSEVNKKNP